MRYRLQRHDGTDCSATMVPITVLRMVPIQRYRQRAVIVADNVLLDVCDLGLDNVVCGSNSEIYIIQERERIRNILEKNHGNVSQTAIELGCSRTALYKKMKKVGLK